MDGFGLNFSITYKHFSINLPICLIDDSYDADNEMDLSFSNILFSTIKKVSVFFVLNVLTRMLFKRLKKKKNKQHHKQIEEVIKSRESNEVYVSQLKASSDLIHSKELNKENGIIIEFALYGKASTLKRIINEYLFITDQEKEEYLRKFTQNVDYEVLDVTIPLKYQIRSNENESFLRIYQTPKTKILGFVNPIFSSTKPPKLLIKYLFRKINLDYTIKENPISSY